MRYKRWQIIVILGICLAGIVFTAPNLFSREQLQTWPFQRHINLGLDLRGGSYLLLEVDYQTVVRERLETALETVRTRLAAAQIGTTQLEVRDNALRIRLRDPGQAGTVLRILRESVAGPETEFEVSSPTEGDIAVAATEQKLRDRLNDTMAQSIEIVRRRIDETGVNEPSIARQGANRIVVQLPGVQDPDRVKRLLGTTAKMTFRLLSDQPVPTTGRAPPGTDLLPATSELGPDGRPRLYPVRKRIEVDGASLTDARPSLNGQTGEWVVNFTFDTTGARRFAQVTEQNVGRPFAIVLDNKVISAPVIREPITGGRGQISGSFTAATANELAVLLRAGALPAPLKVIEERTVGPDLGEDSIRAGIYACVIGGLLVVAFMIASYGLFGVFAAIALIVNLLLLLGALTLLQATLTLPGIVGILLTVGMSVDANVLINERIREETRKGRSPISAIEAGFARAMATIIDANLTTLIKMMILFALGSGPVKGFAVTISIGIITSFFTATGLVRMLIALWYERRRPKLLAA